MANLNIKFNDADYYIDESALAEATASLKSHLSTTMSGTGAKVSLGGISYNIDSTKLTTATNNFVSHLGTISGSGAKVKVNGVEYAIGTDKISGSISELEVVLGGLYSPTLEEILDNILNNGEIIKTFDISATTNDSVIATLYYNVKSDNYAVIIDGVGKMKSYTNAGAAPWSSYLNLTQAFVLQGITNIGAHAFSNCKNLTSITIPDNVTNIRPNAFSGCSQLTNIIYTGTIAQWNAITLGTDGTNWRMNVPATYVQCSDGQVSLV